MRVVLSPHGDGSRMQPTGTRKEGSNGFSACSAIWARGQRRGHRPSRARCDLPGSATALTAAEAEVHAERWQCIKIRPRRRLRRRGRDCLPCEELQITARRAAMRGPRHPRRSLVRHTNLVDMSLALRDGADPEQFGSEATGRAVLLRRVGVLTMTSGRPGSLAVRKRSYRCAWPLSRTAYPGPGPAG
jgi:hypothetical protein